MAIFEKIRLLSVLILATCLFDANEVSADKTTATENYLRWFVSNQSGDDKLAERLASDFRRGWTLMIKLASEKRSSAEIFGALKANGHNAFLLEKGASRHLLPGRTVSFLVMNKEGGCRETTRERWTANDPEKATSIALVGGG